MSDQTESLPTVGPMYESWHPFDGPPDNLNRWVRDADGCEHFCIALPDHHAHVSLERRPLYCDRGHWQARCEGVWKLTDPDNTESWINTIDHADGFPRYYMNKQRARDELLSFLVWRMFRTPGDLLENLQPTLMDRLLAGDASAWEELKAAT